jgi:hypothetical protein
MNYMLIVLKKNIPVEYAVVGAAHASVAGFLKWEDDDLTYEWAHSVFYKHIKIANDEEFEKCKLEKYGDKIVLTESSLDGEETAIVYRIQKDYPQFLKTLPRWKYQEADSSSWPP